MKCSSRGQALAGAGAIALLDGLPSSGRTAQPTTFMIAIRNVATDSTLRLLDDGTTNAAIAPGVFVVRTAANPFTPGVGADEALERLPQNGNFQPLLP